MRLDFSGQVVLVTGASRGIGEQMARDFAACGGQLVVTSTQPRLDDMDRFGDGARHIQVDFTDPRSTERFLDEVRALERLDVCVNNAATTRHKPIGEVTDDDWEATVAVNLKAAYFLTQAAAEVMKRRRYGRIVNISSIWGHVGFPTRSLYGTTKFGLRGVTSGAAADLASFGILANTVSPGFTVTDMFEKNYSPEKRAEMAARVPLGRLGEPADVSRAVLFLASGLNSYITGQSLVVDGGYSAV